MRRLVVTGTGTGVGKTIVTAAIAAVAAASGQSVGVVKPAQTGLGPNEESDVAVIQRLSGIPVVHELVRYRDPLAPATAARCEGVAAVSVGELADRIRRLGDFDLLLVEGAGGLLVRLDAHSGTLADLARVMGAEVVVVTPAGLGSLNAAALTVEAMRHRGLVCAGLVIGDWPREPGLAEQCNLQDLPDYTSAPLLGAIPTGAGALAAPDFLEMARDSLAPALGGRWDPHPEQTS